MSRDRILDEGTKYLTQGYNSFYRNIVLVRYKDRILGKGTEIMGTGTE